MVAGIVGALVRTLITASVDQQGGAKRRAYYNWVVTTLACLPLAIFVFFFVAGVWNMIQGYGAWEVAAIGLAMTVGFGALLGRQIIGREAAWDENGVKFRWLGGEADLSWKEIEKVEMRPHRRTYARIRFNDGRTFGIGAQCTGCNALLHALGRHGVPFHKWGTSEPLPTE